MKRAVSPDPPTRSTAAEEQPAYGRRVLTDDTGELRDVMIGDALARTRDVHDVGGDASTDRPLSKGGEVFTAEECEKAGCEQAGRRSAPIRSCGAPRVSGSLGPCFLPFGGLLPHQEHSEARRLLLAAWQPPRGSRLL